MGTPVHGGGAVDAARRRAELGAANNDSAILTALRRGSTDSLNQAGQQVVRRTLNIQPTITVRPGFPVRVIVNRDLEGATGGRGRLEVVSDIGEKVLFPFSFLGIGVLAPYRN